jgi:regulatory protein
MSDPEAPPTIVGLRVLSRGGRVRLTASDGSEHTFAAATIDAAGAGKGDPLDRELLGRLEIEQQRSTIHDAALRFLNHRDRSAGEVRTRLAQRGFEAPLIDEELARLERSGLLDDEAFARAWVSDRVRLAPRSRRMLRLELAKKGVAAEIADAATDDIDDEASATSLAERKAISLRNLPEETAARRVRAFLLNRGYAHELAARAAVAAVKTADFEP